MRFYFDAASKNGNFGVRRLLNHFLCRRHLFVPAGLEFWAMNDDFTLMLKYCVPFYVRVFDSPNEECQVKVHEQRARSSSLLFLGSVIRTVSSCCSLILSRISRAWRQHKL